MLSTTLLSLVLTGCSTGPIEDTSVFADTDTDTDTDGDTDTDSDTDTDADTDADIDTDTDGDTDTDTGAGAPPDLSAIRLVQTPTEMILEFDTSDVDEDLDGGTLELILNGSTRVFDIPDDIDVWTPGGTSQVVLEHYDPCTVSDYTAAAVAVDAAGHRSFERQATHALQGTVEDEGTDFGPGTTYYISDLTFICGGFNSSFDEDQFVITTTGAGWMLSVESTGAYWLEVGAVIPPPFSYQGGGEAPSYTLMVPLDDDNMMFLVKMTMGNADYLVRVYQAP